jgi:uncharacterized RDD family membrane protein YckC
MNLEQIKTQKNITPVNDDFEFDFKPITSGLGFNHSKPTDIRPMVVEKTVTVSPYQNTIAPKKEMNLYQNDLSLFYGQASASTSQEVKIDTRETKERSYTLAPKALRIYAYLTDLLLVASFLAMILTVMARTISMDLLDVWTSYPNEITPLVITLFCGFYILYFSVFEKTAQSTLGKNIFGLRVVTTDNKILPLSVLILRSVVGIFNFISLGLFSYFDLQNKITSSKVVRTK